MWALQPATHVPSSRGVATTHVSRACQGLPARLPVALSASLRPYCTPGGLYRPACISGRRIVLQRASPNGGSHENNGATPGPPEPAHQPASSSSTEPSKGDASAYSENRMLEWPLLVTSMLSHVNRQYIRIRRRQRWWKKSGGYPRVPVESVDHLPEPAVQLWHKVIPLGLIFFCASFNLTILQSLKDAIMVTAGGAETLPFLASFGVLPASLGFFVLYGKMVSRLPERSVFYAAVAPLLAFYAVFATALYPAAPLLHPLDQMPALLAAVPAGLHGLVKMGVHWTYSLFFCMAELWGAVVISVLFWSLANDVCTVDEAKSVYPFMAIGANIALVIAGTFIRWVNSCLPAADSQLLGLRILVGTVMVMSAAMFAAKRYIDTQVLPRKEPGAAAAEAAAKKKKRKKSKGSFSESFAVLKNSPKIRNLALLVMSYGVGHRLFEFTWKGQLRSLYPTVQAYQSVLADVATYTGALTLANMFVSRLVFKYLGWGVAASVTPVMMGIAGCVFFGASIATGMTIVPETMMGLVVAVGATAGVVTQVFARASKYSFFDPAKEMVYIEMDKEEKSRGKAAVDLVGSQIGKSGASWLTQAFLIMCGSLTAAMPFLAVCFLGVIVTWVGATWDLHHQMGDVERDRLAVQKEKETADAAAAAAAAAVQVEAGGAAVGLVPAVAAAGAGVGGGPLSNGSSSNGSSNGNGNGNGASSSNCMRSSNGATGTHLPGDGDEQAPSTAAAAAVWSTPSRR